MRLLLSLLGTRSTTAWYFDYQRMVVDLVLREADICLIAIPLSPVG